jgi:hypothetical protein
MRTKSKLLSSTQLDSKPEEPVKASRRDDDTNDRPLSRAEASTYLKDKHNIDHSYGYLGKLAHMGGGPEYYRLKNKITRYTPKALDAYAKAIFGKPARSAAEHDVAIEASVLG